jgi:hypothetical protein
MKKMIVPAVIAVLAIACNNPSGNSIAKADSTNAQPEKVNYAYTIDHPDYWEMGSPKNTEIVLNSLKAYENGDIKTSVKSFSDSVELYFDKYSAKLSNDSLSAMFTKYRNETASMKIKMEDFISVISKDKKEEWVCLWYKQIMTDIKGKIDSVAVHNDLKLDKGKITILAEYTSHYPVKK